jgi:hypothetical protein
MKALGITSTAILALSFAVAAPIWAQEQQQEEQTGKPAQQEEKKAQPEKSTKQAEKPAARPEQNTKPQQNNAQQQEKNTKQEKSAQQQEKNAKPEKGNAQNQPERPAAQSNESAQQHPSDARTQDNNAPRQHAMAQSQEQEQHGGGRIPEDRFKASFGEEHRFHVDRGDYDRDRHFQYSGFSFGFVDAWPNNWLYTQDVYVIEIDGVYYLCNPMYPGVNIQLSFAP